MYEWNDALVTRKIAEEQEAQAAMRVTPHEQSIEALLNPNVPKTEREHAAAREIEKLRAELAKADNGLHKDAERWRWLVRHASLSFDDAPSWNAVVRLPAFASDDQTITALVDRARASVGN